MQFIKTRGAGQGGDASVILLKPKIKPRPLQAFAVSKLSRPMPSTNGSGAGATICTWLNNLFFTAGHLLLDNARNGWGMGINSEIGLTAIWLAYSPCPLQVINPPRRWPCTSIGKMLICILRHMRGIFNAIELTAGSFNIYI